MPTVMLTDARVQSRDCPLPLCMPSIVFAYMHNRSSTCKVERRLYAVHYWMYSVPFIWRYILPKCTCLRHSVNEPLSQFCSSSHLYATHLLLAIDSKLLVNLCLHAFLLSLGLYIASSFTYVTLHYFKAFQCWPFPQLYAISKQQLQLLRNPRRIFYVVPSILNLCHGLPNHITNLKEWSERFKDPPGEASCDNGIDDNDNDGDGDEAVPLA